MKETIKDLFGFMYSLSMGDYFFFIGTFLLIVLFIYIIYFLKQNLKNYQRKKKKNLILVKLLRI